MISMHVRMLCVSSTHIVRIVTSSFASTLRVHVHLYSISPFMSHKGCQRVIIDHNLIIVIDVIEL